LSLAYLPLRFLEVSLLHHPLNPCFVEDEMTTALFYHPGEGYIGYVTWYMVFVPSSYVSVHACEPTLLEAGALVVVGSMFRWEVPECGCE
jgi:hypothetical protein